MVIEKIKSGVSKADRLFGIVVSTSDCHPRGPGFDSRLYPRKFSESIGSGTGFFQTREDNWLATAFPPDGVSTLAWWEGLSGCLISRAKPAVVCLLVGSPLPDRLRLRTQMKRDTLVLQVGGLSMGLTTPPQ